MYELPPDQIALLKKAFDAFDREKKGCIGTDMVKTILEVLGTKLDDDIVEEVDSDGNGFITTAVLKEIFKELDDKITGEELDLIEEVDSDGSGTVDFDEFMEVMTGE